MLLFITQALRGGRGLSREAHCAPLSPLLPPLPIPTPPPPPHYIFEIVIGYADRFCTPNRWISAVFKVFAPFEKIGLLRNFNHYVGRGWGRGEGELSLNGRRRVFFEQSLVLLGNFSDRLAWLVLGVFVYTGAPLIEMHLCYGLSWLFWRSSHEWSLSCLGLKAEPVTYLSLLL